MTIGTIGTSDTSFTLDGRKVTYAGLSCFRLLDRFHREEDITPVLRDYQSVMAETSTAPFLRVLRVFAMANSFMQLKPGDYPYTKVSALTDFVQQFGFIIQWECQADCQAFGLTVDQRRQHVEEMGHAVNGRKALLSLGNEWQKNGWNPDEHERPPTDVLCSRGSSLGDSDPPLPKWGQFSLYHGRRDGVKGLLASTDLAWAVAGYPGWPGTHQPTTHDEEIGAAESSSVGRRSATPSTFYRLAEDAASWGAGGTFHSDNGLQAQVLDPIERGCAQAWMVACSKPDPAQRFSGILD